MPFQSKAQRRAIYAKEEAGELPKGTAAEWERHTKGKLPERKKKRPTLHDWAKSR